MPDSPSPFAALPPRQKAVAVLFFVILIFIGYEVIGLFRGSKEEAAPKSSQPISETASKSAMASKSVSPQVPPANHPEARSQGLPPQMGGISQPLAQQEHPQIERATPPSAALFQEDQAQTKYISALNELQMLKIQKEIAETSQAIVAAKLATVTAEKSISDLLSEAESMSIPSAGIKKRAEVSAPVTVTRPMPNAEIAKAIYTVQSISMELDQWHAVLKYKDKLYDVGVGDYLPPDNSLVKGIDSKGVTLESSSGVEEKIPLTITDNVPLSQSESKDRIAAPPSSVGLIP